MAAVASGEEVHDEVLDFFFLEVVEQRRGHEGNFGDVAFGDVAARDASGVVGLGDVGGEVDFLVVSAGFATKKNGAIFEGDGHGGVLFGDDEGGLQNLSEQAIRFEFSAYGSEVWAEGSALSFEEVAGGTELSVEGFSTTEGATAFGGEGIMKICDFPCLDKLSGSCGRRWWWSGGFQ